MPYRSDSAASDVELARFGLHIIWAVWSSAAAEQRLSAWQLNRDGFAAAAVRELTPAEPAARLRRRDRTRVIHILWSPRPLRWARGGRALMAAIRHAAEPIDSLGAAARLGDGRSARLTRAGRFRSIPRRSLSASDARGCQHALRGEGALAASGGS